MPPLHLANEHVALSVEPEFGARITSLVERSSGRDWLIGGPLEGSAGDDAGFGAREARGWDECFPTVAPCLDETHGRPLRDHGDLWGRPWHCDIENNAIRSRYDGSGWRFVRDIELTGNRIETRYAVTNTGNVTLPYLWSQHCLLATGPGDRIDFQGIGPMTVTGGGSSDGPVGTGQFDWPELSSIMPDLRSVRDASAGFWIKAYAPIDTDVSATVGSDEGSISVSWKQADIPYLGLWLDYGGWPQSGPVHQIAIEPTTAPADDLATAHKVNLARWLSPGETHSWMVTMRLAAATKHNGERHVE
ncbi:MAG: hypothetical protein NXI27_20775 [Alphaproteobacteria bacterium]|nr:hypothetical protein [Alphaproteobacteria bacterium]